MTGQRSMFGRQQKVSPRVRICLIGPKTKLKAWKELNSIEQNTKVDAAAFVGRCFWHWPMCFEYLLLCTMVEAPDNKLHLAGFIALLLAIVPDLNTCMFLRSNGMVVDRSMGNSDSHCRVAHQGCDGNMSHNLDASGVFTKTNMEQTVTWLSESQAIQTLRCVPKACLSGFAS